MNGEMDGHLALLQLVLAVPLAVSGLRRFADPAWSRRALTLLAPGELVAAVGLVSGEWMRPAALLALACLLVSVVAAAPTLARHGTGGTALPAAVRGMALAIPAVVLVWEGHEHADLLTWFAGLALGQQITVATVAVAVAAVSAGIRPPFRFELPDPGPPAGSIATPAAPTLPPLIRRGPELTIGMATYDDFDGVYFTLQALRLYHDLDRTELLVVDNYGCEHTRDFVRNWAGGTYLLADDIVGTSAARDRVFRAASGAAVLCCDSHVLFEAGAVARLRAYHRDHPDCTDLLQGPLVYDDGRLVSTHFDPVWREQMWGVWATDPRGTEPTGEPFEIPMQGLGVFSCRTEAWPGFHPGFRGFGGEEGYIHEKFRQAGHRCLCLPWLRWMHRFGRPRGTPYPLLIEDKLRNYLLGHLELGLDAAPVLAHFSEFLPAERMTRMYEEAAAYR